MNIVHQYPPELTALLVDAIPRLLRSKKDVLGFFRGAGVDSQLFTDIATAVRSNPASITKFDIVRQVLTRLNDKGDAALAPRREILKRVTEWDDFSTCWDNDRMQAKGYIAEIQRVVNVKDSFTRMNLERERERADKTMQHKSDVASAQRKLAERQAIMADLYALFQMADPHKRGSTLEAILNRLFKVEGLLVRESFKRIGNNGEGTIEQIDGVVEIEGHVYLVEVKWWANPLGVAEVSEHLVRVFHRNAARGLLIGMPGFTQPAITICQESLAKNVFVLAKLEELVHLLEQNRALIDLIRRKVQAAIVDKNPLLEPHRQ